MKKYKFMENPSLKERLNEALVLSGMSIDQVVSILKKYGEEGESDSLNKALRVLYNIKSINQVKDYANSVLKELTQLKKKKII